MLFETRESPEGLVILNRNLWGYWWLEKVLRPERVSPTACLAASIVLLAVLTLPGMVTLLVISGLLDGLMLLMFVSAVAAFILSSHYGVAARLIEAERSGLNMRFHYFTPSLFAGEYEEVTVGRRLAPFWFSAYKIVIEK